MGSKFTIALYSALSSALLIFVGCYVVVLAATLFQGVISGLYVSVLVLRYVIAGVAVNALLGAMTKVRLVIVWCAAILVNLVLVVLDLNFIGAETTVHGGTVVFRHSTTADPWLRNFAVLGLVAFASFIACAITTEVMRRFEHESSRR